jgi:hypothetical protein
MNNIKENFDNIELFINNNIINNDDKIICNFLLNNLQNKINCYIIESNNESLQNNTEMKKQNFIEERINDINNKFILYMQNKTEIENILNDFYYQISNNDLLENLISIYNINNE